MSCRSSRSISQRCEPTHHRPGWPDPVGRHGAAPGTRARVARLTALAVFWAAGLMVGFFAVLSAAAKFSCARTARGLACRPAGTVLAVGLVITVILIVAAV